MNRWKLELILKSGAHVVGYYAGSESNMEEVARRLVVGSSTSVNIIDGDRTNEALVFCVGDIAACLIAPDGESH